MPEPLPNFDSLVDFTDAGTRRAPVGLRFGARLRSLDAWEPRESPVASSEFVPPPYGKFARLRRCRRCREWFLPPRRGVPYCSDPCRSPPAPMGRPREREDATCRNPRCLKSFRPVRDNPAYCSAECRRAVGRLARKIDPGELVRLHLAGTPVKEMAAALNVTYAAARRACLRLGLSTQPTRRTHLTLDEAKALILSGATFGVAYGALLTEEDAKALKEWYCRTPGLPIPEAIAERTAALSAPAPSPNGELDEDDPPAIIPLPSARPNPGPIVSHELCRNCGGFMVRTGTCLTCQACGTTSGGCG